MSRINPSWRIILALILALGLLTLLFGCKRVSKPKTGLQRSQPTYAATAPTVTPTPPIDLSPESVEAPTPEPTPEVVIRHVAPRIQPTPEPAEVVKAVVQRMPSVQRTQWESAKIKPIWEISVNKAVMLYLRTKARYEVVEKMRSNGVPAPVLFTLHYRESTNDFSCHPHEGSSLLRRTKYVPKNRPPPPANPPFSWEFSAEDAYYVADKLQGNWSDLPWALNAMERFNGMGYKKRGVPSPYLWSGLDKPYVSGKYIADGRYSPTATDKQLGTLAILRRMKDKGIFISFDP